jgi:pimeloyl-ACP methyl ester carboxylesterase
MGFRAIAPDMRGYGRSSVYGGHEDYAQREIVQDMVDLIDALGRDKAVWVGHDWGAPVVWNLAAYHAERRHGVANLCVPYLSEGFTPARAAMLADRTVYPEVGIQVDVD